jgi:hypothetical protein
LARLSARFSLTDLPAFLDKCCRGDLSAMVAPWLGAWLAPQARQYAFWVLTTHGPSCTAPVTAHGALR